MNTRFKLFSSETLLSSLLIAVLSIFLLFYHKDKYYTWQSQIIYVNDQKLCWKRLSRFSRN